MKLASNPTSLRYYGGKNANSNLCRWIANQTEPAKIYAEPFAGMAGILLLRPPTPTEIINDINKRVSTWWEVVRDHPDELIQRLAYTPWDDNAHKQIRQTDWNTKDKIWQAWAFMVLCEQSFSSKPLLSNPQSRVFKPKTKPGQLYPDQLAAKIQNLRHRLANVQIWNINATEFLKKTEKETEAMIYCDPPYYTAHDDYEHNKYNIDEMTELFQAQQSKVLISGYPGEWDHLGWQHNDLPKTVSAAGTSKNNPGSFTATERVWANYDIHNKIGKLF